MLWYWYIKTFVVVYHMNCFLPERIVKQDDTCINKSILIPAASILMLQYLKHAFHVKWDKLWSCSGAYLFLRFLYVLICFNFVCFSPFLKAPLT